MALDLEKFYQASNPSKTLDLGKAEDQRYYIDFSSVRGNKIIQELKRTITRLSPDEPTCQLFTGHIGCGKSTELLRLRVELEQQGFHVVYFESSQDLDMADVDISDILLAIARQVSKSLEEVHVRLQPREFKGLLQGTTKLLPAEITLSEDDLASVLVDTSTSALKQDFSLAQEIGKITAKAKDSQEIRFLLRQYLEPRVNMILEAINHELIEPAIEQLKQQGKQGLAVIVDNLDRVDNTEKLPGRTQPEYLFVDRGEQLNKLHCHVVYTIPRILVFSSDLGRLTNRFGIDPKMLPMVQVKHRDGTRCEEGVALLRQVILSKAFPEVTPEERLALVTEVFDSIGTLDRLCLVSGGHVRNLLVLLYRCLQREDPPIKRECLESVVRQRRNELNLAIARDEWHLLRQVNQEKTVRGEDRYQALLRSLFIFEYCDRDECWFEINPILEEARELQI
ncbi:P-loop NTPase fold protein [Lyngbya aestuarii]|uniref:P-loop NTPase fold protein n=1 Tax=Lyngbya aestuarii TaxID=118322 RepID=UPI00403D9E22